MANVDTEGGGGGGGRHQKKRAKKLPTRLDMTPMVDLGFLLLTFFMLTTTFSKPKVIGLTPPAKTDTNQFIKIKDTLALTVILSSHNKIYYYNGTLNTNPDSNNIKMTNFGDNGIRKIIMDRNHYVLNALKPLDEQLANKQIKDTTYQRLKQQIQGNKEALFVIIKTDSVAKYVNVISLLDEMAICNVDKYALIDAAKTESMMIRLYNSKNQIP